jgi:phosphatidylinositol alpha-1,6-mannosyltransferase
MSRRLLVLTPDFPPAIGGIQRVVSEIAGRLADSSDLVVVAPADATGLDGDVQARFDLLRTHTSWGGAGSAAVLAEMALVARRSAYDGVVAAHVMTLPAAMTRIRDRPVVGLLYGSELWDPRAQSVLRRHQQRVSRFVAISEFTRARAVELGVPADRVEVVALGADEPVEPPDALDRLAALGLVDTSGVRPYLLTVSRLAEPHKGQDAVLRAVPALAGHEPRFRYVVAGDGPLRHHLEQVAETAGATRAAVFAGRVDEATKGALITHCRALAMVSREARAAAQFEGFGLVYLEAALAGRPSLAGRAGAAPEVVADEETGLLVDPDRPAQIAAATLRLLEATYADALGKAARERARATGTWAHAGDRLQSALERSLA